ncbi:helix-turn-helix transcriptional regulator [Cellulomonas gilvus]|uniref:Helix-turn-helix domain protein n=1 Tax=Cellulomonas gilvus (strain ATCC 13127 / NRRL B-14078) TaxID=593907 RepID=F8A6S8_CELGA|nr:helix-turn-helix transcriptional regulator [Cellulomonas gilvus]AEI11138.1 helix-turn-helix domain protein [Cellulomonas gilvus ATCC 13127]
MDRPQLADFLRARRAALQPEDVGLPRGSRRRTAGLRREEVAALCGMSADYYGRLEQGRGPQPSEPMLGAIARGLHLTLAERDHLFRLAGHHAPDRAARADHVAPAVLRIVDRLHDTPAMVVTETGETLVQTPAAMALLGDQTRFTGLDRSTVFRWFTDPSSRDVYPPEDHDERAATFVAELRAAYARGGAGSRAHRVVEALLARSDEFATLWAQHRVDDKHARTKRMQHPDLGTLTVDCQTLLDTDTGQRLLVFTATPGTPDSDKLALLTVLAPRQSTPAP